MHWVFNFENGKSPCRVNQAAAAIGELVYLFGGFCQQKRMFELQLHNPIDVHVLNTVTFKWHKRVNSESNEQFWATPYFRYGHSCVVYNDLIYLWGGRADWTNILCNSLFLYKPKTHIWSKVDTLGNPPDGRDGHSACVINDSMLIFGGFVQKINKFSNDIYEFNFKTSAWTKVVPMTGVKPHWRDFHSASAIGTKMYVFGGRMDYGRETYTGKGFYSNDLYEFDVEKREWIELKPDMSRTTDGADSDPVADTPSGQQVRPDGRRSHSAVVHKRKIIIFGGFQENIQKHFNDLFEFDVDKNEWKQIKASGMTPCARRRHSCCVINGRMFLFGGTGPFIDSSDDQQLALIATENEENENLIGNIRLIEPALHRLEINLNQINNALRSRNIIDLDTFNNALSAALDTLARPRRESNEIIHNDNNQINNLRSGTGLPVVVAPPTFAQSNLQVFLADHVPPQLEFAENLREQADEESIQVVNQPNQELVPVNNHFEEVNENDNEAVAFNHNHYIVEEEDGSDFYENDDDELLDSDNEDLTDEDADQDYDHNHGLISLSDLHVLDLEIPSLRTLCMIEIIDKGINYDSLPTHLLTDLNSIAFIED